MTMSLLNLGFQSTFRNIPAVNLEKKHFLRMFSKNYRSHVWRQQSPRPAYRANYLSPGAPRPLWTQPPQGPSSQHYGFSQFGTMGSEMPIRTVKCGELRSSDCGQEVEIAGRVQNMRMNRFLMLRDETGITQLVAPELRSDLMKKMSKMPLDSYVKVRGEVLLRPEGSRNETMATGNIEVLIIDFVTVQHKRKQADEDSEVGESKRSKTKSAGIKLTTEEVAKAETMEMRSYFAARKVTCGDLGADYVNPGDEITLCGWVQTKRPPAFIVLKDGYGEIQLVPSVKSDAANVFKRLKQGAVIFVKGILARRPFGQGNSRATNGLLEVSVSEVTIITKDSPICTDSIEANTTTDEKTELPVTKAPGLSGLPNKYTQRTHTCGELRPSDVGKTVTLMGWVEFVRLSKFLILRDGYGSTQVLISDNDETSNKLLNNVSLESILEVTGTVCNRPSSQVKKDSETGEIEVLATKVTLVNEAEKNLPFSIRDFKKAQEPLRMKHRYLDLRFKELQHNLRTRSKVLMKMREFLVHHLEFVEIETPTLFKRTPGGAREFVVPTHNENLYYSLVQSPQQLKQLLMVGGMDRYFQIARCYRDEATKPDRQPEFTQLDIELSFCCQEDVMKLVEDLLVHSWPEDVQIQAPFNCMTYAEAMETYGSDKPDLRFDWKIIDFTDDFLIRPPSFMKDLSTKPDFRVCGIVAPKGHVVYTNALKKSTEEFMKEQHPKAMHFLFSVKSVEERMKAIFGEDLANAVLSKIDLQDDSTVFVAAGPKNHALESVGKFRVKWADLMEEKGLRVRACKSLNFLWVTDFPLFAEDENGGFITNHHPFTAPRPEDEPLLFTEPSRVIGLHYDLVLNGSEIGGGSIRIHNADLQERVLKDILKLPTDSLTHLLAGLRSGAPPHGGIALGIDRLIAMMVRANSIRDVIAFPKSVDGKDPMSGAPGPLTDDEKLYYHLLPKCDVKL